VNRCFPSPKQKYFTFPERSKRFVARLWNFFPSGESSSPPSIYQFEKNISKFSAILSMREIFLEKNFPGFFLNLLTNYINMLPSHAFRIFGKPFAYIIF
jgi:hypothetical protein